MVSWIDCFLYVSHGGEVNVVSSLVRGERERDAMCFVRGARSVARSTQRSTYECTCTHALYRAYVPRSSSRFPHCVPPRGGSFCGDRSPLVFLVFLWHRTCRPVWAAFGVARVSCFPWQEVDFETYLSTDIAVWRCRKQFWFVAEGRPLP